MTNLESLLAKKQKIWLITGVAGFIGSHLLDFLLRNNQVVIGLDNFSTGYNKNLKLVKNELPNNLWNNFTFYEGDICRYNNCEEIFSNDKIDYVLHQAALGSVPRSIEDPINTNKSNISGFLNILFLSKKYSVDKFIYAASSSTYGDNLKLPKVEDEIGEPLSPYAITKYVNELYANNFAKTFNMKAIGLRYFNVFGPRQCPDGAYAAVIPRWIKSISKNQKIEIYGKGDTTRDFTFVDNVVKANILSALHDFKNESHYVFNIACGEKISLLDLYNEIKSIIGNEDLQPIFMDYRVGDVKHSLANISKAKEVIGYYPEINLNEGLKKTIESIEHGNN